MNRTDTPASDHPALGDDLVDATNPDVPVVRPRRKFYIPWGLFIILAVYGLGVLVFVWQVHWTSPDYLAAGHYTSALALLGDDEGRSLSSAQLATAYEHLLEAGRLKPEVKTFHDLAEGLNWRFDERGEQVPGELRRRAEANATLYTRIMMERRPILVVGARSRGWAPEQLVERPRRIALWSPLGAVPIIAIWAYLVFTGRRVVAQEKEEYLQGVEEHVKELGHFRRRGR
jgi:hypothetical protein